MSKKLRVLECFSGIGACSKALDRLGVDYEIVDSVEIDKYAVQSFNAIHGTNFEPQDITEWDKDIETDLIMHGSPCFRKGELVNTIYGLTPIEQIKIGDTVKTADGQWRIVSETFISKSDSLMDIKPSCAHLINTTENHPFYTLRGDKLSWVEAKDLTTKDYLCVPINTKKKEPEWEGVDLCYNGHKERSVKLPVFDSRFWYLIGRFIGDGWVTRRKDRADNISGIKICCAKNELVELEQKLGGVLPYCVVEDSTTYKLQFCNKELGAFCENFGIGAINKHIPQQVLDLDNKYLLPLYNGIMDSDGCCVKHRYKLETISKQLAYNMGELVLKLFNVPYQISKTTRPEKYEICGRVVNQHNTYSTFWRDSGYNKNINFVKDGYLFSRIRKIESIDGADTVYNLEVEGEHTYCVNNVAVHNCQDFSVAGLGKGGDEGSGTRSSLMYETLRIVEKLKPKYVIWENVKNLLSKKHKHNFDAYIEAMEKLGYKSYYKVLNAKDFGVPQNRERVYTISIKQEGEMIPYYEFPEGRPLTIRLKDVLEHNVDEKFYLTDEQVKRIKMATYNTASEKIRVQDAEGVARTLCARDYKDPKVVRVASRWGNHQAGQIYNKNGLAPTLDTGQGGSRTPMFIENGAEIIEHNKDPKHQQDLVQDEEGICRTILAGTHGSTPHLLKTVVREKEPKLEYVGGIGETDRIGDGKALSRNYPQGNRVYSTEGIAVSQTANGGGLGGPSGLYMEPQPVKRRRSEYGKEVRKDYEKHELEHSENMKETYIGNDGIMPTITASRREQRIAEPYIAASRGRSDGEWKDTEHYQQLEPRNDGMTNTISSVPKDNYVVEPKVINPLKDKTEYGWHFEQQVYDEDGIARAVKAGGGSGNVPKVIEPEGFVEKAYSEFADENGYMPEMFNPYNKSEIKDIAPTQTTQAGSTTSSATVLVKDKDLLKTKLCKQLIEDGIVQGGEIINHSYTTSEQRPTLDKYIENKEGIMPTITTRPDCLGYVEPQPTLRIRKLTPKETWRLMSFDDEDFDKAQASGVSNSQLYKQAGNSIVVNVLEAILGNLIPNEYYKIPKNVVES